MSKPRSPFDDLFLRCASLEKQTTLRLCPTTSLTVSIPTASNGRSLTLGCPYFSRRPSFIANNVNWPAYCSLVRDLGIPLYARTSDLESLSVANIPLRFSRRAANEPLDAIELETSEAFEITCRNFVDAATESHGTSNSALSSLPIELDSLQGLDELIGALRDLTDRTVPIGIGIVAGAIREDVLSVTKTSADFVVIEYPKVDELDGQPDQRLIEDIRAAGRIIQDSARPITLLIDAPINQPAHLIKMLALGADAVSIDALVASAIPAAAPPTPVPASGLLSGIGSIPVKPMANIGPIDAKLRSLLTLTKSTLSRAGAQCVAEFGEEHIAISSDQSLES